ncbi:FkbM family methyltransferase [Streptomyces sp. NPDC059575]|uniref:FkbM family methyltransferase n=1 Tax=Streptomyces sp. NPDC059575 TaxID=3346872 RepID=UPI0036B703E0
MPRPAVLRALRAYVRHLPAAPGTSALAGWLSDQLTAQPVTATARTRFGADFPVTTSDVIQRYLYLFGVWEPHLTQFITGRLRPGDGFVDVGANIGYYSVLARSLVGPTGPVVAIEPCPDFHLALRRNTDADGWGTVRTVQAAVGTEPGPVTFYLETSTNLGGTTTVRPRTVESTFQAQAAPVHELVTAEEFAAARLIKIDVEGAEAAAVTTLLPVLDRLRDDAELLIEVTPRSLAKQGLTVDDVLGPLKHAGFHIYRVVNDYDAASYPRDLRHPTAALRWGAPITTMTDLVLSRTDAETLPLQRP